MFGTVAIITIVFMAITIVALGADVATQRKKVGELENKRLQKHRQDVALKRKRRDSYFHLRQTLSSRLEDYLASGEINPTVYYYVMGKLSDGGFTFMADLRPSELMELQDIVDENYQDLLEEYTQGEQE